MVEASDADVLFTEEYNSNKLWETEYNVEDTLPENDEEKIVIASAKDAELLFTLLITEFITSETDAELLATAFITWDKLWDIVLTEDAFRATRSV